MGNYTIFQMFENPRRGRQARNFTTNVPKILDLKSSSEQTIFRKLQTLGAPVFVRNRSCLNVFIFRFGGFELTTRTTPGSAPGPDDIKTIEL